MSQVFLSPDDFSSDLNHLGHANGNIFRRVPGVAGVHDGQVMVRLKKKRFVILDYSIQPNDEDLQITQGNPSVKIPNQAGKSICTKPGCHKVGIPVCLYDSDPCEPDPLYMRIGLCFECQRTLNENRRSDKKRPAQRICGGHNHDIDSQTEDSSVLKAIGPLVHKKTKIVSSNDKMVSLPHEAFIATGEGIKSWSEGYGFREIGLDLVGWVNEAAHETGQLIQATMPTNNPLPSQMYHPLATTADTTGTRSTMEDFSPSISSSENHDGIAPAASTIESNIAGRQNEIGATISPNEEVDTIYHKSLQSLQNSIFLLTQWKLSWDGTLQATAAIAGSDVPSGSETDPSSLLLNDAVASAAAVVAASMTPTPSVAAAAMALSSANVTSDWPDTLASLLLAADQSNDNDIALTTHHDRVVDWNMQPAQNERAVEDDPDDVSDGVGEFPYD